jgi:hypothetical protein
MGEGWAGLARRHQDDRRRRQGHARCRARRRWRGSTADVESDHAVALAFHRLWYGGSRHGQARTPKGGEAE